MGLTLNWIDQRKTKRPSCTKVSPLIKDKLEVSDFEARRSLWFIKLVECELQHLINHSWKQVFDEVIWLPEVRIRVDFNQPSPIVFINQEIEAKKLE